MSQRLGMSDGRCFTFQYSNELLNAYIMESNGIGPFDNYKYRQLIQRMGVDALPKNDQQYPCGQGCDGPSLKITGSY